MIYIYNVIAVLLYGLSLNVIGLSVRMKNSLFFFLTSIHLGLFHALRNPFNYKDNQGYANAYEYLGTLSFSEIIAQTGAYSSWDIGYNLFNKLISYISPQADWYFAISGFLMVVSWMFMYKRYSYMPLLSVVVYMLYPLMFYQSMYVLRQHMAAVFMIAALLTIRNLKISIPLSICAALFHISAIVFFPFFVFHRIDWLGKGMGHKIISAFIGLIIVVNVGLRYVVSDIERYAEFEEQEGSSLVLPIIVLGSLVFVHFINKTFRDTKEQDKDILSFLLYGFIITIACIGVHGAGRLSNYFIYSVPFALPLLFKYNKDFITGIKRIFLVVYMSIILFMFWNVVVSSNEYVINNVLLNDIKIW